MGELGYFTGPNLNSSCIRVELGLGLDNRYLGMLDTPLEFATPLLRIAGGKLWVRILRVSSHQSC